MGGGEVNSSTPVALLVPVPGRKAGQPRQEPRVCSTGSFGNELLQRDCLGCDPVERPELGASSRDFASGVEMWGRIVAGSCPGSTASRNYQRGEECCVLCVGRGSQAIPFLILSPLLCAGDSRGRQSSRRVLSSAPSHNQHGPLLASPSGQHCLLPLLCNPKVRRTLFDPAAGAVASLLFQRFSHPSFSLSQSQYRGNGKLLGRGGACCELSWKGKGLPPAASPSEPGSWAGCPPLPGGWGAERLVLAILTQGELPVPRCLLTICNRCKYLLLINSLKEMCRSVWGSARCRAGCAGGAQVAQCVGCSSALRQRSWSWTRDAAKMPWP